MYLMESKKVLNVRVDFGLNVEEVVSRVEEMLDDEKCHCICTTNPEFVIDAQNDEEFKKIINESDLSVPDGNGVLYANYYISQVSKFNRGLFFTVRCFLYGIYFGLSSVLKEYDMGKGVTGVELTHKFCELAAAKGYNVFLLGGWPKDFRGRNMKTGSDFATQTAEILKGKYPGLKVIGASSQFSRDECDDENTVAYIKDCMKKEGVSKIDFLFVAYNHIHQEKWIVRNRCKIPAKVCVGVGGTFDYINGHMKYAPEIYRNLRIEWLYKLLTQPWRYKRIFKAFPTFPIKIFCDVIKK